MKMDEKSMDVVAARLLNVCFVWILVPERRREKDQRYFSPGWNEGSNAPPSVTRTEIFRQRLKKQ